MLRTFEGGMEAFSSVCRQPISASGKEESNASHEGRWGDICIAYVQSEKNRWTVGKSIEEIAAIRGVDPADACFDLIVEERGRVTEVNYGMCEEDIEYIMSQRFTMIGSDGEAASLDYPGQPHPRWFGTFPRVIAHYSRDRELFRWNGIQDDRPAGCAARVAGPGLIREGIKPISCCSLRSHPRRSPRNPKAACEGIHRVYAIGVLTAHDGAHTARVPSILRR